MSINSSLIKLANKIDTENISNVEPDYKNPNNSIEKSIERIADNYSGSGGGGGGALIATANMQTGALDKTWNEIKNSTPVFIVVNGVQKIVGFVTYIGAGADGKYYIGAISYTESEFNLGLLQLVTDSADGYPVLQQG